ncbi:MAG: permease [Betaproteobacteria bacterium]|nr:permease [Betaproteobacteria bacterium]MBI2292749.1 permease [Betaproteobacteria bacterium]
MTAKSERRMIVLAPVPRISRMVLGMDRVVLATIALLAGLALTVPEQAVASAFATLRSIVSILPFTVLAVALAAGARATGCDRQIARAFAAREAAAIVAAALIGALSFFCGMSVVPLVAAALVAGVPLSAVMAFWISSPLMNPAIYILTAAEFDVFFATARLVSAIGLGLVAGFATRWLVAHNCFSDALRPEVSTYGAACGAKNATVSAPIVWRFWNDPARRTAFVAESRTTGLTLLKWMTLAFLLESLLVAYVPTELVTSWVGGEGWWAIPLSVAVGIPAYLNGYAAIPTVARLVEMGMSPGAALAFMTAGAVTSFSAMAAVFALVRPSLFGWYISLSVMGALAVGYAYQGLVG